MVTSLKREGSSRAVLGRSIWGGVAAVLLLAGMGGAVTGFPAASPALAQERHDDRDRNRDRRDHHPYYYRPAPVYAPPAVIVMPPVAPPAIDFVFPINIR